MLKLRWEPGEEREKEMMERDEKRKCERIEERWSYGRDARRTSRPRGHTKRKDDDDYQFELR
jgi:hypothetical protein